MAPFQYTALNATGQKTTGQVETATRVEAMKQLRSQGLTPVEINESKTTVETFKGRRGKFNRRSVENFCRELANLLAAGIPMNRSLSILAHQASRGQSGVLQIVHAEVTNGQSLADAMSKFEGLFNRVEIAMVRAGETGGFLDVVLAQIADFQSRERDLKGRIKSALAYPAVLAGVSVAVLAFLLTYFIPQFSVMFEGMGGTLPALTQAIIALSNAVVQHGPLTLLILAILGVILYRVMQSNSAKRQFERILLGTPLLGRVIARFCLVRFSRMLGTLIASGVPLIASLRVAREALGNQILADTMKQSIEDVTKGKSLSNSLRHCEKLFPLSTIEMLAVAEEAGRLDQELQRLANVYEQDMDRQLRTLVTMAEPLLLFIMAALVGTIVIGMLLPIFSLQEMIQ